MSLQPALEARVAAGAPGALARVEAPRLGLTWDGAAGHLARGESRALRPDDAVRVASVTKSVTAVAAVTLARDGRLAFDSQLGDQLAPELLHRGELTQWTPGASFPPGHRLRYQRYGLGMVAITVEGVELLGHTGFIGAFAFHPPNTTASWSAPTTPHTSTAGPWSPRSANSYGTQSQPNTPTEGTDRDTGGASSPAGDAIASPTCAVGRRGRRPSGRLAARVLVA